MIDFKRNSDPAPIGILIVLSTVFPGAGQLANGQNSKGIGFIAAAGILLALFFVYLAFTIGPILGTISAGKEPVMTDDLMSGVKTLAAIFGAGFIVWIWATIDAVIVGKKRLAGKK